MRPQIVKIVTTLFVTIFVTLHSWGQKELPPPPPPTDPPVGLPIDSGLIFLVLTGLILGLVFLLRKKRV